MKKFGPNVSYEYKPAAMRFEKPEGHSGIFWKETSQGREAVLARGTHYAVIEFIGEYPFMEPEEDFEMTVYQRVDNGMVDETFIIYTGLFSSVDSAKLKAETIAKVLELV